MGTGNPAAISHEQTTTIRAKRGRGLTIRAGANTRDVKGRFVGRGGQIVAVASNRLRPNPVHVVLLASCWNWIHQAPNIHLGGPVLSLRDASDPAISCGPLAENGDGAPSFEEIVTQVGKAHGTFYEPRKEWVDPLRDWLRKQLWSEPDGD